MVTSPNQQGLKRRRQAVTGDNASARFGPSALRPSREARIAWDDDFPAEFDVLEKIGEGSFGTVWTATATATAAEPEASQGEHGEKEDGKGLVALKRINPTCSPSRILNEFNQMRKLGAGEAAYYCKEAALYSWERGTAGQRADLIDIYLVNSRISTKWVCALPRVQTPVVYFFLASDFPTK